MDDLKRPDVDKLWAEGDVRSLIEALGYGPDWVVRRDAALALGRIGDESAVEPLRKAQDDTRPEVCQAAHEASGEIAVKLVDKSLATRTEEEQEEGERSAEQYWKSLKPPDPGKS